MSRDFLPLDSPGAADFSVARVQSLRKQAQRLDESSSSVESKDAEIQKAASGFESIFVHMLMKSMKTAMLNQDKESEGAMSFGGAALDGFVDLQFAEYATKQGGLGLAEQIYTQMGGSGRMPLRTQMQNAISQTQSAAPVQSVQNDTNEDNSDMIKQMANFATNSYQKHIDAASASSRSSGNSFLDRVIERIRPFESDIRRASQQNNVPSALVKAVIAAESAGQPNAISPAGAKGLMQLMDGTAGDLGVKNSLDPSANIAGGTQYLGEMLSRFDGDQSKALAAYNAGPGNVEKYKGIPPFPETKAYITNVQRYSELFAILENTAISHRGFPL